MTNGGTIAVQGVQANGILAQSIGGGGGSGGVSDALVVALGGSGGSGGESGDVKVTNTGGISTTGYGAAGILAQSIVGAGGAAGVADATLSIGATGGSDAGVPAGTDRDRSRGSLPRGRKRARGDRPDRNSTARVGLVSDRRDRSDCRRDRSRTAKRRCRDRTPRCGGRGSHR